MNMNNYDATVWFLHRKLFHRYMKFHKFFDKATESVPEYRQLLEAPSPPRCQKRQRKKLLRNHRQLMVLLVTQRRKVRRRRRVP